MIVCLSDAALPGAVEHLVHLGGAGVEADVIEERLDLLLVDDVGGPEPGVPGPVEPLRGLAVHDDTRHGGGVYCLYDLTPHIVQQATLSTLGCGLTD